MSLQVFRCSHCGREVLVRMPGPLSKDEVRRRIREEMQPDAAGPPARAPWQDRLREDIWVGVSGTRTHIPREAPPESCPSCGRPSLALARVIDPD